MNYELRCIMLMTYEAMALRSYILMIKLFYKATSIVHVNRLSLFHIINKHTYF